LKDPAVQKQFTRDVDPVTDDDEVGQAVHVAPVP
jgi:hypothetical protein